MKESERIKAALETSNQLIYEWDLKDDSIKWTGNTAKILGTRKKLDNRKSFLNIITSDDLENFQQQIAIATQYRKSFQACYNIRNSKKELLHVIDSGKILPDKGKPKCVIGAIKVINTTSSNLIECKSDLDAGFLSQIELAIDKNIRQNLHGSYLKITIDNLALLIAWYDTKFIDEVIEKLGHRILKLLGKSAIVKRIYIDQFGIILNDCSAQQTERAARKIYALIENFEFSVLRKPMHITASIGGVTFPDSATTATEVVRKAFLALSIARNSNDSFYYDYKEAQQQQSHSKNQTMLMHYIHDAIKDNKISFAYQPMIESRTGKVVSYECLIRITSKDGKVNSPGAIIPIAEKMGFIDTLDQLVLERVVAELKKNPKLVLSFNASSLTTDNPKWLKLCTKLLKDYDLASRVIVEITETAALRDLRETAYFVASLQALGCMVALDDFGAGYTSFRQLKTLSVDIIKIDGAFIRGIISYPDNRLFVKTLLDFTNCYGLKTVAECVEDGESAKVLMDMNVDYMQGYYFGRPQLSPPWLNKQKDKIKKTKAKYSKY